MIENWEQYKDLEYYPGRVCACGCGGGIKVRSYHKYDGIPKYISGHNTRVTGSPAKRPEVRKLLSEQKVGDKNPAKRLEVRAKIAKSNTGKTRSEESKKKQGESTKNSPKFKEAMKNRKPPRQGTDTSLQARENMRVGAVNRKTTPEYCESRRRGALKYFSILENRIKRVEELKQRLTKRTRIELPRLGNTIYCRSSYEKIALFLLDSRLEVSGIYYEKINIPYVDKDGVQRIYVPDILVELENGLRILIEVKPEVFTDDETNQLKFKAALNWAEKNNIIFCIWTEDILYNDSSTTMSLQVIVEATVANSFIKEELKV